MAIERDVAELEAACAYWQRQLRLEDWRVYVRWDGFDLAKAGRVATVSWKLVHKTAYIDVLVPELYPEEWHEDVKDFNSHLVHELLHLHFASFAADDDTPEDTAQEQAIEFISQALARLKREVGVVEMGVKQPRMIMLPPTPDAAERERFREAAVALLNCGADGRTNNEGD